MSYEGTYKKLVELEGRFSSLPAIRLTPFPEKHIFDEEESVKWNREEVKRRNAEIKFEKEKIRQLEQNIADEARNEIIHYLMDDYGFTEDIAAIIFKKAEEEGHSSGFCEVLSYANSFGDFAQDLFTAERKENT